VSLGRESGRELRRVSWSEAWGVKGDEGVSLGKGMPCHPTRSTPLY
jgi:hypothetical protein